MCYSSSWVKGDLTLARVLVKTTGEETTGEKQLVKNNW
jgi:hypothetical protein